MRTVSRAELADSVEIVSFLDRLEETFTSLECQLLDSLSPKEFATVQRLVEAGRLMTEAQYTLGMMALARTSAPRRSTACHQRQAIRRTTTHNGPRALGA